MENTLISTKIHAIGFFKIYGFSAYCYIYNRCKYASVGEQVIRFVSYFIWQKMQFSKSSDHILVIKATQK